MTRLKRLKATDLKVGATYCNRGAGTTRRKILGIGDEFRPTQFYSFLPPPCEPGVEFQCTWTGAVKRLYISSFLSWVGEEITEGKP